MLGSVLCRLQTTITADSTSAMSTDRLEELSRDRTTELETSLSP